MHTPPVVSLAPTCDRLSLLMNALQDTVAMPFRIAYETECRRQALALFPIDLVIADVLGPGSSSSVGDPSIFRC